MTPEVLETLNGRESNTNKKKKRKKILKLFFVFVSFCLCLIHEFLRVLEGSGGSYPPEVLETLNGHESNTNKKTKRKKFKTFFVFDCFAPPFGGRETSSTRSVVMSLRDSHGAKRRCFFLFVFDS
jgi:hypothetical protein